MGNNAICANQVEGIAPCPKLLMQRPINAIYKDGPLWLIQFDKVGGMANLLFK